MPATKQPASASNAAAAILCDPERRSAYDSALTARRSAAQAEIITYPATCSLTIDPELARSGGSATITAFYGPDGQIRPITVTIPPDTQAGAQICVPGAGGPQYRSDQRGDLVVTIALAEPQSMNAPYYASDHSAAQPKRVTRCRPLAAITTRRVCCDIQTPDRRWCAGRASRV